MAEEKEICSKAKRKMNIETNAQVFQIHKENNQS